MKPDQIETCLIIQSHHPTPIPSNAQDWAEKTDAMFQKIIRHLEEGELFATLDPSNNYVNDAVLTSAPEIHHRVLNLWFESIAPPPEAAIHALHDHPFSMDDVEAAWKLPDEGIIRTYSNGEIQDEAIED